MGAWGKRQGAAQSRAHEREAVRSQEREQEAAHGSIEITRERAKQVWRMGPRSARWDAWGGRAWLDRLVGPVGLGDE
jgi:hypothetical protein